MFSSKVLTKRIITVYIFLSLFLFWLLLITLLFHAERLRLRCLLWKPSVRGNTKLYDDKNRQWKSSMFDTSNLWQLFYIMRAFNLYALSRFLDKWKKVCVCFQVLAWLINFCFSTSNQPMSVKQKYAMTCSFWTLSPDGLEYTCFLQGIMGHHASTW